MTDSTLDETRPGEQEPAVEEQDDDTVLELDTVFDILGNRDRRRLLRIMDENAADSLTRRDLAIYLVPEHQENPLDQETNGKMEQMLTELRHSHLPKLEAASVIARGRTNGVITRGPNFEEFLPFLELADAHSNEHG